MLELLLFPFNVVAPLLLFGSLWFWFVTAAASVALIAAVECDHGKYALGITILVGGAICYANGINPFAWLYQNPLDAFAWFGGYVVLGVVYGVGKWWLYLYNLRERYDERRTAFFSRHNLDGDTIPEHLRASWYETLCGYGMPNEMRYGIPQASKHKAEIVRWMTWWPWSGFWTLFNDPIKRLFNFIVSRLGGLMQKISDSVFRDIKKDFG